MVRTPHLTRRALIATGLATLPATALPGTVVAANGQIVTMLGDSITAGFGLAQRDSLPLQLEREIRARGKAVVVKGAGVSGDTSAGGAARVDYSVRPGTALCIVALGGNDLLRGLDPEVTRANLDKIIRRLKARHITVVLAGLQAPPQIGRSYARDFNAIFPALAREHGIALYPDLLAGVRDPALRQADGIHPNAKGVKVIAKHLAPVVVKALGQTR